MLPIENLQALMDMAATPDPRGTKAREYIGASIIGSECSAMLALALRGFPNVPVPEKTQRIYTLGHKIEELVIADIMVSGLPFSDRDPATGKQYSWSSYGGHVIVNIDGLLSWPTGEEEVAEVKSMNEKRWRAYVAKGLKVAEPKYYDQLTTAMGLSGIRSGLMFAYNKNTSQYHVDRIGFDEERWLYLQTKIELAMTNSAERISNDKTDFRCFGCPKMMACHGEGPVPTACRTCAHAYPDNGHSWWCMKWSRPATAACTDYTDYMPKPAR